ncbi:MAG TPA: dihydrofolate reductase family protein [Ktedonobacterales bacterium]|nr:dihydrofolate reductase family protein [Ktedonobacterales bacterium]
MGRIVVLNRISLDGYYAGPNGEFDWFVFDPELDRYVMDPESGPSGREPAPPDTVVFGRVTYESFEAHWPHVAANPNAGEGERRMADALGAMTKVVFSTTRKDVTWQNSRLLPGNVAGEVRALKDGGASIIIFGSGTVIKELADAGLIDEYQLIVTPRALGAGKALFAGGQPFGVTLLEARAFPASGNVLLRYAAGR